MENTQAYGRGYGGFVFSSLENSENLASVRSN